LDTRLELYLRKGLEFKARSEFMILAISHEVRVMNKKHDTSGGVLIFRRFRRGRSGKLYDAWKYGIKAWPIRMRGPGVKR